ncbi:hypothetical protein [Micromonospora sp. U21]|uniref:hypothetical protein n=1 Tax=Micromonospora sp. U21 TaxID=2824899 RepID=UPI001B373A73|nr:hypothetical protein [Micromonospora sp. U21]MBQ0906349.1 hypothetical protein [Micromonospora sp. U21]
MGELVRKHGGPVKAGAAVIGTLASAALAQVTGEALASSAAGAALGALVDDLGTRQLSRSEERRIKTAATAAAKKIRERYEAGDDYRDDGFFKGDPYQRSTFEEVAEGVMLSAQREHEERKTPYLGNLIANLAFDSIVDRTTANWAIRTATELSWTQFALLSAVGRKDRSFPNTTIGQNAGSWESWAVHEALVDLTQSRRGLIKPRKPEGQHSFPRFSYSPNEMELDSGGLSLFEGMSLDEIPDVDIDEAMENMMQLRPTVIAD